MNQAYFLKACLLPIKELNVLLEAEDPPDDIPEALK